LTRLFIGLLRLLPRVLAGLLLALLPRIVALATLLRLALVVLRHANTVTARQKYAVFSMTSAGTSFFVTIRFSKIRFSKIHL